MLVSPLCVRRMTTSGRFNLCLFVFLEVIQEVLCKQFQVVTEN